MILWSDLLGTQVYLDAVTHGTTDVQVHEARAGGF